LTENHTYRQPVLDELARHGLKPLPTTSPQELRDVVRDLYKYEIRRLKGELLARRFPRSHYAGHVIELRKRYRLLSIPMELWTV